MFKLHCSIVYPLMPFFVVPQFFHSSQTTPSTDTEAKSKLLASPTHTTGAHHGPDRFLPVTTVIEPPSAC